MKKFLASTIKITGISVLGLTAGAVIGAIGRAAFGDLPPFPPVQKQRHTGRPGSIHASEYGQDEMPFPGYETGGAR